MPKTHLWTVAIRRRVGRVAFSWRFRSKTVQRKNVHILSKYKNYGDTGELEKTTTQHKTVQNSARALNVRKRHSL